MSFIFSKEFFEKYFKVCKLDEDGWFFLGSSKFLLQNFKKNLIEFNKYRIWYKVTFKPLYLYLLFE